MKPNRRDFLLGAVASATFQGGFRTAESQESPIWFERPADRWLQALPIGNGRLGAMVFGGATRERLHLTESTLWSGGPATHDINPAAKGSLQTIRDHMFQGRYTEAESLCRTNLLGKESQFGTALPMAFLEIETILLGEAASYRRSLDLDEAIAKVAFSVGDLRFQREVFASHPAGLIVVHLTSSIPGKLSCNIGFGEPRLAGEITVDAVTMRLKGNAWENLHSDGRHGTRFECHVQIIAESGEVQSTKERIAVRSANAVTLLIAAASDFDGNKPEQICASALSAAGAQTYESLRSAHIADFRALYRRVSIDLGQGRELAKVPIDARRERFAKGGDDPELCALFFQYGRYLTIAGSREDSPLPLALQGIWNDGLAASMGWTDDFHLDINTQQNYWLSEVGNLSDVIDRSRNL